MGISLGIDVGAISIQAALVLPEGLAAALLDGSSDGLLHRLTSPGRADSAVLVTDYRRTKGRPFEAACRLLADLAERLGRQEIGAVRFA